MGREARWFSKSARGIIRNSILAIGLYAFAPGIAYAKCSLDKARLIWQGGSATFKVEVRDTFESRAEGLMHRESLPKFAGMLFIYDRPQTVGFWMRNTLIPLDMLFFDETGTLVRVHENAVPLDETVINGGTNIQYVLEVNAGLSSKLGIKKGAKMEHPDVAADFAEWPCKYIVR